MSHTPSPLSSCYPHVHTAQIDAQGKAPSETSWLKKSITGLCSSLHGRIESFKTLTPLDRLISWVASFKFPSLNLIPGASAQELIGDEVVLFSHTTLNPKAPKAISWNQITTVIFEEGAGSLSGISRNRMTGAIGTKFFVKSGTTHAHDTANLGGGYFADVAHQSISSNWEIVTVIGRVTDETSRTVENYFIANQYSGGTQRHPAATRVASGRFAAIYSSDGDNALVEDIFYREFAQNGQPVGSERLCNENRTGISRFPEADEASNSIGLAWQTDQGGDWEIVFRPLNKTDYTFGTESILGPGSLPNVIGNDDQYLVYWKNSTIRAQMISEEGELLSEVFDIDSGQYPLAGNPSGVLLDNGNYAFAWPCGDNAFCLQILSPDGVRKGVELMITTPSTDQVAVSVVSIGNSTFEVIMDRTLPGKKQLLIQTVRDDTLDFSPTQAPSSSPTRAPSFSPTPLPTSSTVPPFALLPTPTGSQGPSFNPSLPPPTITNTFTPMTTGDNGAALVAVAVSLACCAVLTIIGIGAALWKRRRQVEIETPKTDSSSSNDEPPLYHRLPKNGSTPGDYDSLPPSSSSRVSTTPNGEEMNYCTLPPDHPDYRRASSNSDDIDYSQLPPNRPDYGKAPPKKDEDVNYGDLPKAMGRSLLNRV